MCLLAPCLCWLEMVKHWWRRVRLKGVAQPQRCSGNQTYRVRHQSPSQEEPEGTTTTLVHYILAPTRDAFGRSLSCVVRHPALSKDFRIPYKLNVFCECE